VIGDALRLCNASLNIKEKKYKAVVLISDGEGHDEKVLDAVKELQDNGVVVHSIGIGSPDGSPIFDPATNDFKKDESGNTVVSKLNEKELQEIAAQTQGSYHLFSNSDQITNEVMGSFKPDGEKTNRRRSERSYTSYYQWFLLAALILLILEIIIPERKMKWLHGENNTDNRFDVGCRNGKSAG
jgi:Ca-activated chloride channel family protein